MAEMVCKAHESVPTVLAGTLLYAARLAAHADRYGAAATQEVRRGLEHLYFTSALCQLLGLIGTVAGFLLVLTGGFATVDAADQASLQHLLSRVAEGSATALVSTFTGVVASVLISLAAHLLAPAAE